MADYRQIPDERGVFHEYRTYAFVPELGPTPYDSDEHDTPRALLGSPRGIYPDADADASEPRAVCRHYWLTARVRGDLHPTAGLAAVATPPEYRRQGYVGQLLEHSLEEYRERGCRFAVLWPFRYAFYRQFGWDTSNTIVTHECDPETLAFAAAATDREGSFTRLDADDYERLESAYDSFAERYALTLERSDDWWRYRLLENFDTDPYIYAYERDGAVRGYLIYTVEANDDHNERTMDVSELGFETYDDLLALLSFCHTHDSQVDRVRLRVPEQVPLLEIAAEPDEIETTVETGPMVRIVDVEKKRFRRFPILLSRHNSHSPSQRRSRVERRPVHALRDRRRGRLRANRLVPIDCISSRQRSRPNRHRRALPTRRRRSRCI